jgi:tRNA threonylcarbamoyl adenosine modification protein (Sua5/YciO/YrdC/YwlC family)
VAKQRAMLLEIRPDHPEPYRIQQAVAKLLEQRVILYPTDTIYGLGADIASKTAIDRIYALRKLDDKKPLSLVVGSLSEASRYAVIDNDCFRAMKRMLPGPYTFILRATREAPRMGDAKRRTVGIRMPAHPVALALVRALGRPLLSASAIIEDEDRDLRDDDDDEPRGPETSDPIALAEHYGPDVAMVIDAGPLSGVPSTIIDWSDDTPVIVRRGAGDVSGFED